MSVLGIVYIAAGIACVVYYFVIGLWSRFGLNISWIWPAAGAVLIAAGLLTRAALPHWLRWAWRALLGAVLALVIGLECLVISGMHATAPAGMDYLIVLGASVYQDGPSPALTRRLNAVMACLGDHPDAVIIASGGQGADEPMSEAACIREELIRRGVDADRIIVEDKSTSTMENIRFSMALMDDPDAPTGLITNNYHVYRATRIARKAGLKNVHGIAAMYTGHTKFHYMIREAICLVVDYLRGNL